MGVFEFIIALVVISTIGKVLTERLPRGKPQAQPSPLPPGEVERIHEALEDLNGRLLRIEEERDFYRELLESPERRREGLPPGPGHDPSGGEAGA
ncbi:MAG: hypothetical protein P8170_22855 [Gemmatimonadota bacterium]